MSPYWLVSILFLSVLTSSITAAAAATTTTGGPLLRGAQQQRQQQQQPKVLPMSSSSSSNNTTDNDTSSSSTSTALSLSLPAPAAVWSLPLHAVSGTHHVNVNVGEPLSRRTLIVDTGSRLTAWVCNECHNCGRHANVPYSLVRSNTAVVHTCAGGCEWEDTSEAACRGINTTATATEAAAAAAAVRHLQKTKTTSKTTNTPTTRCGMRQKYTEGSSWTAVEVNDIILLPVHHHRQSSQQQSHGLAAGITAQHENTNNNNDNNNNDTSKAAVTTTTTTTKVTGTVITAPTLVADDDTVIDAWQEDVIETAIPFTFGCQDKVHDLFRSQYADGIMGLEATEKSIVHQLYKAGRLQSPIFSLCLTPDAGYIGFGGAVTTTTTTNTKNHHSLDPSAATALEPMRFTPLISETGKKKWYAVQVVEFYLITPVNDNAPHITNTTNNPNAKVPVAARGSMEARSFGDAKGTILDSGTTDTYLPQDISHAFEPAWKALTGHARYHNSAVKYTHAEFLNLPNFVLVLDNNVNLVIPAVHYMEGLPANYQRDHSDGRPATAWPATRSLSNRIYMDEPGGAVLGLNAMMGHDILFDVAANRIGFAPANCHGHGASNAA
jgi:hypothetical protein